MENRQSKHLFITLWLASICVLVFLIQQTIPGFTENFLLSSNALSMPWQFLTSVFLHGSIIHLAYNLFALILFGLILEKIIGSKKILWLFLISGILANIVSVSFYPSSLGASGAIMAILGTLAILRPKMTVWVFNMPMPMFIAAILWTGGSVLGIFGFGDPNVGHIAHLSGIVLGIVYGIILRTKHPQAKKPIQEAPLISEDYIKIWEDNNLK